jgi:formylglycine-generating enzyme required for sulfatase activity
LDTIAHYNKAISTGGPIVVRSKSPNAFGLFDMEGNVAEIVRHMAQSVANGAAAKQEEARVFSRGGSWKTPAEHTRSASRTEVYADRKAADIGFRVILKPVTER